MAGLGKVGLHGGRSLRVEAAVGLVYRVLVRCQEADSELLEHRLRLGRKRVVGIKKIRHVAADAEKEQLFAAGVLGEKMGDIVHGATDGDPQRRLAVLVGDVLPGVDGGGVGKAGGRRRVEDSASKTEELAVIGEGDTLAKNHPDGHRRPPGGKVEGADRDGGDEGARAVNMRQKSANALEMLAP